MIGTVLTAWVTGYAVVGGVAVLRARSLGRRHAQPHASHEPVPVLVIRPCAGDEPSLLANLGSTAVWSRVPGVTMVFSVGSAQDPAWPVVQRAASELSHAVAMVAPPQHPNHKVGQLAAVLDAMPAASGSIVVVIDSDVDLGGYDPASLLQPLRGDAVASWSPPVEVAIAGGLGDRASQAILTGSLQSFALLGPLSARGLVGKTFAITADALRGIGGMHALGEYLAEDLELAKRLAAQGLPVRMVPAPTRSTARGRTWSQALGRYTRWLVALKAQRPALLLAYPLLLAAAPLLLLACGVFAVAQPGWGLALLVAVFVARAGIFVAAHHLTQTRGTRAWLLDGLLGDVMLLVAASIAAVSRRVQWRGRTLQLDARGRLGPVGPVAAHARG